MSELEKAVGFCNQFLLLKTALTLPSKRPGASGQYGQVSRAKKYSDFEKVRKRTQQNT